jgi:preprotein translocase subunit SecB
MAENNGSDTQAQRELFLRKIYIKDLSFESPNAPAIFAKDHLNPETQLNLKSSNQPVGDDGTEVVLTVTVEAKVEDKILFLVELQQAGIFQMTGYSAEEQRALMGSFCPGTLYPYAREAISDAVAKGGFPQLLLQPINFDALYAQAQQQQPVEGNGGGA